MSWHQTGRPRRALLTALTLVVAAGAAFALACGAASDTGRWDSRSVGESIAGLPFTPLIVNSNVGRGPTRLAFALLLRDQTLVLEGEVTARIYRLDDSPEDQPTTATLLGTYATTARTIDTADHGVMRLAPRDRDDARGSHAQADVALRPRDRDHDRAPLPAHDGSLSTMFTTMVDFPEAGVWGADLDVTTGGETYPHLRMTFTVREHTAEPAVGDEAPRTMQPIVTADSTAEELAALDSSPTPHRALHDITVGEAIASGQPALVAFVTPAFCQTRFCGPVLNNVVLPVEQQYGDRVHVIHIEPYDLALARGEGRLESVPAAVEWRLESEPFIAVLDRGGRVTAKFEGIIDLDEVTAALDAALAAG